METAINVLEFEARVQREYSIMPKRILLVEDSITQALKIKMVLEGKGYTVDVATDGEKGVTLATQLKPNLIILDMYLPNLGGLEVCKILKSDLNLRSTAIIMFSQENKLKNITTAYEVGADYYVAKSEESEELLISLIETVFARMEAAKRRV